ncbi:MAG: alpha-galactosidase, partial [Clostridia bacterium]|nr:alpha-galactosidase [Clostridia bacterium]
MSYWLWEADGVVGLRIDPAGREGEWPEKHLSPDALVQVRMRGDDFPFGFANGHTLRNGETAFRFKYQEQTVRREGDVTTIVTTLAAPGGLSIEHRLTHRRGEKGVAAQSAFINGGQEPVTLEMLSSFSLFGLTPYAPGDAPGTLKLHRLRSKWSNEGRLVSEAIEDLQLEPSWARHGAASEKFGQVGSMPVRRWFPFAAVEDVQSGVLWGVQLHAPASWQIEVYRRDDGLCLSGGPADYDFGHWAKTVRPGEVFETPTAHLTACADGLDALCARLTGMMKRPLNDLPRPERLPVVFNEYCATWGCPTQRRVEAMAEVLKGRDIDCFVIDCGWYAQPGRSWELNMGDWRVNA